MPRAPIRIPPARPALLESDWQVAYVLARLEPDVQPADALRRYQPKAFIAAIESAQAQGISPSQQLRSAVRSVDRQVARALVGEARRRGLYGTARGLRMLPRLGESFEAIDLASAVEVVAPRRKPQARPPGFKTLEELQAELPDWGEREVLELWQSEHEPLLGSPAAKRPALPRRSRAERRDRIVRLQRDCLKRLLAPVRPLPSDHLQAWLPRALARRLLDHGTRTLHDLMVLVSREDWDASLRGFGATKAKLIEDWLRGHGLMPARTPPRTAALPPPMAPPEGGTPPATVHPVPAASNARLLASQLAPLAADPLLSGERGKHRSPRSMLRARTDVEAVEAWLDTLRSPNTVRAYRKEALRFMLWAVLERRQALSSMDVEDAVAYLRFLRAIPHDWRCKPEQRTTPQLSTGWRPFDRPALSDRSIGYAATVLHRMYQWLGKVRHLSGNPFGGLSKAQMRGDRLKPEHRHLPKPLTDQIIQLLEPAGVSPRDLAAACRHRLLMTLLFDSGLRRHEAASLTFDRIAYLAEPRLGSAGTTRYELRVIGKGNKERSIPVSPRLLRLLQDSLGLRGLPTQLGHPDLAGKPVIWRMRGDKPLGLSPESIYLACKQALAAASARLVASGQLEDAALVARATTHWTRHSFGMALVDKAGLAVVQELLGHEDINTTRTYARISAATRATALLEAGIGLE